MLKSRRVTRHNYRLRQRRSASCRACCTFRRRRSRGLGLDVGFVIIVIGLTHSSRVEALPGQLGGSLIHHRCEAGEALGMEHWLACCADAGPVLASARVRYVGQDPEVTRGTSWLMSRPGPAYMADHDWAVMKQGTTCCRQAPRRAGNDQHTAAQRASVVVMHADMRLRSRQSQHRHTVLDQGQTGDDDFVPDLFVSR